MAIVAGVDFGTLSVRVTLVDSARGRLVPGLPNILCTAKKKIRITPRRATKITCALLRRPCSDALLRRMFPAIKSQLSPSTPPAPASFPSAKSCSL